MYNGTPTYEIPIHIYIYIYLFLFGANRASPPPPLGAPALREIRLPSLVVPVVPIYSRKRSRLQHNGQAILRTRLALRRLGFPNTRFYLDLSFPPSIPHPPPHTFTLVTPVAQGRGRINTYICICTYTYAFIYTYKGYPYIRDSLFMRRSTRLPATALPSGFGQFRH